MSEKRPTCVNVNRDLLLIAQVEYGLTNLSEFVNLCLSELVSGEQPLEENPLKARIRSIVENKRQEMLSQQHLIKEEESKKRKAEEYRLEREQAIKVAAEREFKRQPGYRLRQLFAPDPYGTYQDERDTLIKAVSKRADLDVDWRDIKKVYTAIMGSDA